MIIHESYRGGMVGPRPSEDSSNQGGVWMSLKRRASRNYPLGKIGRRLPSRFRPPKRSAEEWVTIKELVEMMSEPMKNAAILRLVVLSVCLDEGGRDSYESRMIA